MRNSLSPHYSPGGRWEYSKWVLPLPAPLINDGFDNTTQHHLGCCRHNNGGLQSQISSPKPTPPSLHRLTITPNQTDNTSLHPRDPPHVCTLSNNNICCKLARLAHKQHGRDVTFLLVRTSQQANLPVKRQAQGGMCPVAPCLKYASVDDVDHRDLIGSWVIVY